MTFVFYCTVAQEHILIGTKSEGNVMQLIMNSLLSTFTLLVKQGTWKENSQSLLALWKYYSWTNTGGKEKAHYTVWLFSACQNVNDWFLSLVTPLSYCSYFVLTHARLYANAVLSFFHRLLGGCDKRRQAVRGVLELFLVCWLTRMLFCKLTSSKWQAFSCALSRCTLLLRIIRYYTSVKNACHVPSWRRSEAAVIISPLI